MNRFFTRSGGRPWVLSHIKSAEILTDHLSNVSSNIFAFMEVNMLAEKVISRLTGQFETTINSCTDCQNCEKFTKFAQLP